MICCVTKVLCGPAAEIEHCIARNLDVRVDSSPVRGSAKMSGKGASIKNIP